MMPSSLDEQEDEFSVNPFRTSSGGANPDDPFYSHPNPRTNDPHPGGSVPQWGLQAAAPSQPPQWSQQPPPPQGPAAFQSHQQPQPQLQPDPNSGMTGTFSPNTMMGIPASSSPSSAPPQYRPQQLQQQPLSGTMDRRQDEIPGTSPSLLHRCTSCFRIEGYQPYFDLDTNEFVQRLQASVTAWWQPDVFRTAFLRDEKPDLYGPLWIVTTLVFLLAATSNLAAWASFEASSSPPTPSKSSSTNGTASSSGTSSSSDEFEYDILRLIHAASVLWTFFWGYPTFNWFVCTCLGMNQISWAMWLCLYGYSSSIYLLSFPLCVMPWPFVRFAALGAATAVSGLHVLRNLSGPLLSQDATNQAKASPVILSMMGAHFVLFLVLKYRFFR